MFFKRKKMLASLLCVVLLLGNIRFPYTQAQERESVLQQEDLTADGDGEENPEEREGDNTPEESGTGNGTETGTEAPTETGSETPTETGTEALTETAPSPETGEIASSPETGETTPSPETGEIASSPETGETTPSPETGETTPSPETGENASSPEAGENASSPETGTDTPTETGTETEAPTETVSEITSEPVSETTSEPVSEPEDTSKKEGIKVSIPETDFTYTGKAIKPKVIVTYNGEPMTEGVDYTIKYSNNINAYTTTSNVNKMPKVTVTGKGNWNGSVSKSFKISPACIDAVLIGGTSWKMGEDKKEYETLTIIEGSKKANPMLYYGGAKVSSKDYTIIEKAGDGYRAKDTDKKVIAIKAKSGGNFTGERTLKANVINKSKLKKFTVFFDSDELTYDGTTQKEKIEKAIEVYDKTSGEPLEETDYTVSWSGDTTNAGKVKFTVIGLGLYSGTNITKSCTIQSIKADELDMTVSGVKEEPYTFISTGVTLDELEVTYKNKTKLEKGKDYKVTYKNNKKAGIATYTVSFLGNYKGSTAKSDIFVIQEANLENNKVEVIIADKKYTGKPGIYKSTPYVILDGITLKSSDYTVSYYDEDEYPISDKNKIELWDEGEETTVYVEIEAKSGGNYNGTIRTSYKVKNSDDFFDLSNAKVSVVNKSVTYTGEPCINTLKVYCKKGTKWTRVVEGEAFEVTYANNVNKGKATIIITGKYGNGYTGSKTVSFNIAAQKVKSK